VTAADIVFERTELLNRTVIATVNKGEAVDGVASPRRGYSRPSAPPRSSARDDRARSVFSPVTKVRYESRHARRQHGLHK